MEKPDNQILPAAASSHSPCQGLRGIHVDCVICGRSKAPHGRSVPDLTFNGWCQDHCRGYNMAPLPGCLWPGETSEDFGYAHCANATESLAQGVGPTPPQAKERQ